MQNVLHEDGVTLRDAFGVEEIAGHEADLHAPR